MFLEVEVVGNNCSFVAEEVESKARCRAHSTLGSDTRDPQLACSVIFQEHVFWACSRPNLTLVLAPWLWIVSGVELARQNLDMVCFFVDR